jgi:hypothetical protein
MMDLVLIAFWIDMYFMDFIKIMRLHLDHIFIISITVLLAALVVSMEVVGYPHRLVLHSYLNIQ